MTRCSVPLCSHDANHHFPKDSERRGTWLKAIERDDFAPKNGARICRRHFHRSDYVEVSRVTGRPLVRRCLKKTAVPSVFPWNRKSVSKVNIAKEERRKRHQTNKRLDKTSRRQRANAKNVSFNIENPNNGVRSRPLKTLKIKHRNQETQTLAYTRLFATTKLLLSDDESVLFYTGLDSYTAFISLLSTLLPMANEIKYYSETANTLSTEDQFLILLIKLRRSKPDFEIGKMFGVTKTDVSNIIVTWVSFVTDHWSYLDSWPNQDIVEFYMPEAFRSNCVSNRVDKDAEFAVKEENYCNAERVPFSQYRLNSTLKLIAGCTRDGIVIHCIKTEEAASRNLGIGDESSISGVISVDHKVAKSISMEKFVGSTKTFKILASALNQVYAPLATQIFSVCLMICSISVGIVTVNKDS